MKQKIFAILILTLFFLTNSYTQNINEIKENKSDAASELESKAVKMLKDTSGDVNNLRTLENRISFSTELANLMWFHDKSEARRMFSSVINNYVNLLTQYNYELNALTSSEDGMDDESNQESSLYGGGSLYRKIYELMSVRKQIAVSIAEHDAEYAFAFVDQTSKLITGENFNKIFPSDDSSLENEILNKMSIQDIDKALKIGKEQLKDGFSNAHFELAKKIHAKDSEKGRELADEIVSKIKSDKSKTESYLLTSVLEFGATDIANAKKNSKVKPLFSEESLKEIAETFATNILSNKELEEYEVGSYAKSIKPFSPSRAAQIESKFANSRKTDEMNVASDFADKVSNVSITNANIDSNTENLSPSQKASLKRREERSKLLEALSESNGKQLTKEQKEKFVGEARQIISTIRDSNQKIIALSLLARRVKQLGDKELASELMSQAEMVVNPQPVNYMDYMQTWMLVGGYSEIDADKAFPILENTIYRLNETISAFIKVGEFIDVGGSIIKDGEVQLGTFGGNITKELLSGLGDSEGVLQKLAVNDFDRTRGLAEKFEKPELQIMAKMLILRSVIKSNNDVPTDDKAVDAVSDKSERTIIAAPKPVPPPPPSR